MNLDRVYKQCYVANSVISYTCIAAGALICAAAWGFEKCRRAKEAKEAENMEPADAAVMSGNNEATADNGATA